MADIDAQAMERAVAALQGREFANDAEEDAAFEAEFERQRQLLQAQAAPAAPAAPRMNELQRRGQELLDEPPAAPAAPVEFQLPAGYDNRDAFIRAVNIADQSVRRDDPLIRMNVRDHLSEGFARLSYIREEYANIVGRLRQAVPIIPGMVTYLPQGAQQIYPGNEFRIVVVPRMDAPPAPAAAPAAPAAEPGAFELPPGYTNREVFIQIVYETDESIREDWDVDGREFIATADSEIQVRNDLLQEAYSEIAKENAPRIREKVLYIPEGKKPLFKRNLEGNARIIYVPPLPPPVPVEIVSAADFQPPLGYDNRDAFVRAVNQSYETTRKTLEGRPNLLGNHTNEVIARVQDTMERYAEIVRIPVRDLPILGKDTVYLPEGTKTVYPGTTRLVYVPRVDLTAPAEAPEEERREAVTLQTILQMAITNVEKTMAESKAEYKTEATKARARELRVKNEFDRLSKEYTIQVSPIVEYKQDLRGLRDIKNLTAKDFETMTQEEKDRLLFRVISTEKDDKLARMCIQYGANTQIAYTNGATLLTTLLLRDEYRELKELVIRASSRKFLNMTGRGTTPLTTALSQAADRPRIVNLLLKSGADPMLKDKNGRFPIEYVTREKAMDVARLLVEAGANPNITITDTAMNIPFGAGYLHQVSIGFIRDLKPDVLFVLSKCTNLYAKKDKPYDQDYEPLFRALKFEYAQELINMLFELGLNANGFSMEKERKLQYFYTLVLIKAPLEIIQQFLEKGADVNSFADSKIPKAPFVQRTYVLGAAFMRKQETYSDFLIEKGANIIIDTTPKEGYESVPNLFYLLAFGRLEYIKKVLDTVEQPLNTQVLTSVENPYKAGERPNALSFLLLKSAEAAGKNIDELIDLLEYLLTRPGGREMFEELTPPGLTDAYIGNIYAGLLKNYDNDEIHTVLKFLYEHGMNPNVGAGKRLPISYFCHNNYWKIVKLMIDHRVDLNVRIKDADENITTPLIQYVVMDNLEAVQYMIQTGKADPLMEDDDNNVAYDYAVSDAMRAFLETYKPKPKLWTGYMKPDIELFNTIFEKPSDISLCPICLSYAERTDGCMYMKHTCPAARRHERLYQLFKDKEDKIEWCTLCGRITHDHHHYLLSDPKATTLPGDAPVKPTEGQFRFFDKDCTASGGGGHTEKIKRLDGFFRYVCDLQAEIGKMDAKEAMNELVEAAWVAAMAPSRKVAKILERKDFDIPCTFPEGAEQTTRPEDEEEAPDILRPADEADLKPIRHDPPENECVIEMGPHEDNRPVYQFQHKQPDGTIWRHEGEYVCGEDLEQIMRSNPMDGKCYINPTKCRGKLYPEEIKGVVSDEFYEIYRKNFNRANKVGGAEPEGILAPVNLDEALCTPPPKWKKAGTTFRRRKNLRRIKNTRRAL